jgi:hypothetical protein
MHLKFSKVLGICIYKFCEFQARFSRFYHSQTQLCEHSRNKWRLIFFCILDLSIPRPSSTIDEFSATKKTASKWSHILWEGSNSLKRHCFLYFLCWWPLFWALLHCQTVNLTLFESTPNKLKVKINLK